MLQLQKVFESKACKYLGIFSCKQMNILIITDGLQSRKKNHITQRKESMKQQKDRSNSNSHQDRRDGVADDDNNNDYHYHHFNNNNNNINNIKYVLHRFFINPSVVPAYILHFLLQMQHRVPFLLNKGSYDISIFLSLFHTH